MDFNSPPAGMVRNTSEESFSNKPALVVVIVDDPQMDGFGPTRHTTYRITCQLHTGGEASACRHRFSEFVKLRNELISRPGVVVPPLPDKQVMNRFAKEFVEKRRGQLQVFLQRVIDHPLASSNSALFGFLSWPEEVRSAVVGRYKDLQMPPAPPDDAGDPLKDAAKMTAELQSQLQKVRAVAKRLTARRKDEGMDLIELSQGMQLLGEHGMNGALNSPFSAVRASAPRLHKHLALFFVAQRGMTLVGAAVAVCAGHGAAREHHEAAGGGR